MKTIDIKKLSFSYPLGSNVFHDFSVEMQSKGDSGYIYALMGSSGSGKTTLLKLLLGIEKKYTGTIKFNPEEPVISYIPQEAVLFEHLTPKENAEYFKYIKVYKNRFDQILFDTLVKTLDISDVLQNSKSVMALSGGQKQKLSLVRALSIDPDILLLDEPCNGLDAEVKRQLLLKLSTIIISKKILAVYVTHHKSEAQLIADEIIYLTREDSKKAISNKVQEKTKRFIETPLSYEAAQVFRFPNFDSITCNLDGGKIKPTESGDYKAIFESHDVKLSNTFGFKYRIISQNELYSQVLVEQTNELIVLEIPLMEVKSNRYFYFDGILSIYNTKGMYDLSIRVEKNKIKNGN